MDTSFGNMIYAPNDSRLTIHQNDHTSIRSDKCNSIATLSVYFLIVTNAITKIYPNLRLQNVDCLHYVHMSLIHSHSFYNIVLQNTNIKISAFHSHNM